MLSTKRRESLVSICQGKGCVRRLTIAAVFLGVFFMALGSAAQANAWVVIFQTGPGGTVLPVGPQMVADMGSTSGAASPNANYHFVDWTINSGAGNGSFSALDQANLSITDVTGDIIVTANFAIDTYTLTVFTTGAFGTGTVTKAPDKPAYDWGETVTLTANPGTGEQFDQWGGDLSGGTNPETITIDGDKIVTANFDFIEYTLTVNTVGGTGLGSVAKSPDQATYHYGDSVLLIASAGSGEAFDSWSGDLSGSTNPDAITIDGNETVTAHFDFIEYTLNVTTAGTGSGSVTKAPDQATYHYGDTVTLTPSADVGSEFMSWSGDGTGSPVRSVTIDGNKAAEATFTLIEYTLNVTTAGTGSGSVTKAPDQATYHYGDTVTLTPSADVGSEFTSWSGDGTGSPVRSVTIDGNKSAEATFTLIEYTLNITCSGGTGGSTDRITKSPDQATYHYGDIITLTAEPQAGETFTSWGGDLSGGANPDTILIDGDKNVTAIFDYIEYTVTVNTAGAFGTGTVTKAPDQPTYHYGDIVTLTAVPDTGEEFDQWSGDLSGSANPETITIDSDKNVTANFRFIEYTLNITCTGGTGDATDRVTKSPDQATYHHGDTVTLTAEPQAGETFGSWGGDLSGSTNPETITIDGDKTVTASFEFIEYTLTITMIGTGTGAVTKTPDQPTYHWGDVVQLEAVPQTLPAPGSAFVEWSGDLSGSTNPDTITIDGDKTITAEFTRLFRITSSVFGGNGTISPTPYADVPEGSDITFSIDPNSCWEIFDVAVDGVSLDTPVREYTFTNVDADHTIQVTFVEYTCTITATAEYGGTISPSGPQSVNCGDSVAFTITPGAGNSVEDVLVNGVSVGAVTSYTFSNVKKDPPEDEPGQTCAHYIVAKFTRPPTSCLDISDIPLNTLARSAPANIMFVLDDSGSMDWEFMTNQDSGCFNPHWGLPDQNLYTAFRYVFNNPGDNVYSDSYILSGAARMDYRAHWSGYNRMYYDPTADYQAWPTLTDADPNNPRSHPMVAGNTFNLRGVYETMGPGIIVDNQDGSPAFTTTGTWSESGSPNEHDGSSFYTSTTGDTATFTPNLPTSGMYEVYAWWNCYSDRDSNAEFTIAYDGGTDAVYRDQRSGGADGCGQWVLLGTYDFLAGTSGSVTLARHAGSTGGSTLADAVKFVPTASSVTINNAHYFVYSAIDAKPYLVNIDIDGATLEYYAFDDGDADNVVEDGELTQTASPPADVVTSRTWDGEQQNFANWYSFYRKRELTATAAVSNVIANMQGVQIGIRTINGNVVQPVRKIKVGPVDETNTLLTSLYGLALWAQGTPLRTGLQRVGQYFDQTDGTDGGIGPNPWADAANGGECQQAFAIVMTDGFWNGTDPGVGNVDGNNGVPYADTYWNTLADVAMYYYENDLSTTLGPEVPTNPWDDNKQQHLVTYGVSFGVTGSLDPANYDLDNGPYPPWPQPLADDPTRIDDLWHASVNGRGFFLSASNPVELVSSLLGIMDNISKRAGSASSVSVNGDELYTRLSGNILMFQSSYDTTEGWTGDVKAYQVCTDYTGACAGKDIGEIITSSHVWSAAERLNARTPDSRIIATYNPSTGSGIPFRWTSLTTGAGSQQALLGNENALNYLRGDDSNEELNGGTLRDRYSKLGDIVHSSPVFENGVLYTGGNDGMLHAFAAADDEPYAGAVGGEELFAYVPNLVFDHLSDLTDPDYTHKYYVDLTVSVKSGVNIHGSIATPVSTTLLVGGLGKGGRGYFALDVTDAAAIANEAALAGKVMWEFPNGTDNDMGYTYSKPAIVESYDSSVGSNGWVVIFGNGYNSPNGKAVLYIVNPENGNVIEKIDTAVAGCNGLSTPVPVDVDYDDKVDYVYAGDLRGNMWKFDLTDPDHTNWEIAFNEGADQPLFTARGPGGTTQPMTAKPDVMYHPTKHGYMVLFGTGRFLGQSDIDDTTVQSLYGIWDYGDDGDDDEYLGTFEREKSKKLSNQPDTVSLLAQEIIPATSGPNAPDFWTVSLTDEAGNPYDLLLRLTTNYPIEWETVTDIDGTPVTDPLDDLSNAVDNHAGWYFDLPVAGERATVDAMIRDGNLIAISYTPDDTPCGSGGHSVVHEMSAQSGGRLTAAQFDINGDGVIDDNDKINIGTEDEPVWVAPTGIRKAGQLQPPAILIDGGSGVEIKYFSSSTGDIEEVKEKAARLGISHWREVE